MFSITSVVAQKKEITRAYCQLIDSAEIAITENNLNKAVSLYESAFKMRTYIHTNDLYNAAIVYTQISDFQHTRQLFDSLALRGFPINFFMKKSTFYKFRESNYWIEFMNSFPALRLNFHRTTNWEARYYVEYVHAKDQNIYRNRHLYDEGARKKITNDLVTELIEFFEKRGYPVDQKIGCFFLNDTTFLINTFPLNVVLIHAYQQNDFRLTSQLKKYVEEGLIKPDQFMNWNQYELTEKNIVGNYGLENFFVVNGIVFKDEPIISINEKIDSNRTEVLGCSFDRFCQKIVFQFFNKTKLYSMASWGGVAIWEVEKNDIEKFTQGFKKTDYKLYDSNNQ